MYKSNPCMQKLSQSCKANCMNNFSGCKQVSNLQYRGSWSCTCHVAILYIFQYKIDTCRTKWSRANYISIFIETSSVVDHKINCISCIYYKNHTQPFLTNYCIMGNFWWSIFKNYWAFLQFSIAADFQTYILIWKFNDWKFPI